MKYLKYPNSIVAFCFACALLSGIALMSGCGTTPVQATIKSEAVLITSVDVGMNLWHDYVVAHLTDGKVTQNQIDTIKQAYNGYVLAQAVAKATIEKVLTNVSTNQVDVTTANQSVQSAENDLLSLLNLYIK